MIVTLGGPGSKLQSSVQLTGSKSISNRLLILREVMDLDMNFINLSRSEDTALLIAAINQVNAGKDPVIDIHHAGTDFRFLTAFLSLKKGSWTLTGSDRIKQRPVRELVQALVALGADITYSGEEGFPPLLIQGKELEGGELEIDSSISSQFISALLLISPALKNGLKIRLRERPVSYPYIRMSLALLKEFGMTVDQTASLVSSFGGLASIGPRVFRIESDWSSASYWYSICALSKDSEIELSYLNEKSLQADSVLVSLFEKLGVQTVFKGSGLLLTHKALEADTFAYDFTDCPDLAQTLAVTCLGLGLSAQLTGLKTLKIKETDRISALKTELEKFGAAVEISGDSLSFSKIKREVPETPVLIHTYNDHRMAMSFAPLALVYKSIRIADPDVVSKSYPAFWEDLKSAGFSVNLQP